LTKRADKSLEQYLLDLVEWGEKATRVAGRTSRETIVEDEQAELALARAMEIVGEIAGRVLAEAAEEGRRRFDHDLSNAYRLRNRLAHGYDNVSPEMLYDIARDNIPALTDKARRWLAELPP
jgi:uncharacterized protein with HEPN domain